jgi:hypothetical protein
LAGPCRLQNRGQLIGLAIDRRIERPTLGPAECIPFEVGTELPTPTGEVKANGVVVGREAKWSSRTRACDIRTTGGGWNIDYRHSHKNNTSKDNKSRQENSS